MQSATMTLAQLTKHLQGQHARVTGVVSSIADRYNAVSVFPPNQDVVKQDLNTLTGEVDQAWTMINALLQNLVGMAERASIAEAKLNEKKIEVVSSMTNVRSINGKK